MPITHVASLSAETVNNPETAYLPASVGTQIVIPPSVAIGDVLLIAGAVQASTGTDPLTADGWILLTTANYANYPGRAYKAGTPQAGLRTSTNAIIGVWWRRWTATSRTSFRGGGSHTSTNEFPPTALTIWRGVQGFRDLALITSATTVQWPGIAGAIGDATILAGVYNGLAVSSTVPVTTARVIGESAGISVALLSAVPASAGTTPAYNAAQDCTSASLLSVNLCLPVAPLTPILESPLPSTIASLTINPTFTWVHNKAGYAGSASGNQESFAFRRRIGLAAYEYWNVGTASWGAVVVWNPSNLGLVSFPTAKWANENDYSWSVATTENAGHNAGPFAADRTLIARTVPVVTVTGPAAVVTTPQPAITWTTSFTAPWVAIAYEVKLFTKATADTAGFDPNTVEPVWTSGQYASTALTAMPSIALNNGVTYAALVRVQQTGPQWAAWVRRDFLISITAPATPSLMAAAIVDTISGCPVIAVMIAARDNLLSAADASFEAGVGSWVGDGNTTVAVTTSWFANGGQALKLTATAASGCRATCASISVTGLATVSGVATFRAPVTVRNVNVSVAFYNSVGASLGSISGTAVANAVAADTNVLVSAAVPAGAVTATMTVFSDASAAAEILYVDKAGIAPGLATPWSPGGFTDVAATIEFSDDPISNIWGTLKTNIALVDHSGMVLDYCAQPGQLRFYRAKTTSGIYASASSSSVTSEINIDSFWIIDTITNIGMKLIVVNDEDRVSTVDRGIFDVIGRSDRIVVTGTAKRQAGGHTARCWTETDADTLTNWLASSHALLLQQPMESATYPRHLYLATTSDVKVARQQQFPMAMRLVTWNWTEIEAPLGEVPGAYLPGMHTGAWL